MFNFNGWIPLKFVLFVCQRRVTVQLGSSNAGLQPKLERLQSVNQHAGRHDKVSEHDNIALSHKIPKCGGGELLLFTLLITA